jgi:hypothetical protein
MWLRIATTNNDPRLLQDTILTVSVRLEGAHEWFEQTEELKIQPLLSFNLS